MSSYPLTQARLFSERVEAWSERGLDIGGLAFQHIALCERRVWLFLNRINFAQWDENVRLGLVRHALSHTRDKSVDGMLGLAPDRVDWAACRVLETKESLGFREAAEAQLAFYCLMLAASSGQPWHGRFYVPSTKRYVDFMIDAAVAQTMLDRLDRIEALINLRMPPAVADLKVCAGCSNRAFCGKG